jgi:hypothetical protein
MSEIKSPGVVLYRMAQCAKRGGVVMFSLRGRFWKMSDDERAHYATRVKTACTPWFKLVRALWPVELDFLLLLCAGPVHYTQHAENRGPVPLAALRVPEIAVVRR